MVIKLQIFMIRRFPQLDSSHSCLAVISLDSSLKKDKNFCPQVFLKECNALRKKVSRHINDNFSDFSSSGESNEEQIKAIRLMVFERTILNMYFLRKQF